MTWTFTRVDCAIFYFSVLYDWNSLLNRVYYSWFFRVEFIIYKCWSLVAICSLPSISQCCMIEGVWSTDSVTVDSSYISADLWLLFSLCYLFLLYVCPDAIVTMYVLSLSHLLVTFAGAQVLSSNYTCSQSPCFDNESSFPECW